MGWWSTTVMGGDTPLDFEGDMLIDICGLAHDDYLENGYAPYRHTIESHIDELVAYCDKHDGDDQNIAFQVLGVILMGSGAAMSADVKEQIEVGINMDEWADEDSERKEHMRDYLYAVHNYDTNGGTVVTLTSEGLFEKIFEALGK